MLYLTRFNNKIIQTLPFFKHPTLTINLSLAYCSRNITVEKEKVISGGKNYSDVFQVTLKLTQPAKRPTGSHCWQGSNACFVTVLQDAYTVELLRNLGRICLKLQELYEFWYLYYIIIYVSKLLAGRKLCGGPETTAGHSLNSPDLHSKIIGRIANNGLERMGKKPSVE